MLEVSDVSKQRQDKWVIRNISLELPAFRKLAIAGETGSGKSTLLQMIAGIINPDKGEVYFENIRVKKVPEEKLLPGHPGIAYLSQQFELSPHMRVEEVLAAHNELEDREAERLYALCQIDHLLERRTDQLSGGERQRIALARLLGTSPRLLLLDEPYSNLDPIHKETLKAVIVGIGEQLGMTCILVSHDPLDTVGWADEIIVLRDGVIVQQDNPHTVYYNPVDAYTAGLFGKYTVLTESIRKMFSAQQQPIPAQVWCLRPNMFSISRTESEGVKVIITDIYFAGSFYELQVRVGDSLLYVFNQQPGFKTGESVFLAFGSPKD